MSLRHLIFARRLSTTSLLRRPKLSDNYKSTQLWDQRFSCKLLCDEDIIRSINNKIIMGDELNNLEVDIFVNIASPKTDEIAQLQESTRLLKKFRRTLYAHALIPSTPHALCRLFLDSGRVSTLATILESRVDYGIFPDPFAMNLLLDEALDKKDYALASRFASLVMLQEEFGLNTITDVLSLYAMASYIESKTNFDEWIASQAQNDPILAEPENTELGTQKEEASKEEAKKEEDEEEEEDAEYIRVPFLRNPYNDNHFDIKNPRLICGKTLSMMSNSLTKNNSLSIKTSIVGQILQGKWSAAEKSLVKLKQTKTKLGKIAEVCEYYMENLHDIEGPSEEQRQSVSSSLKELSGDEEPLTSLIESNFTNLADNESKDIEQFRSDLLKWSEARLSCKKSQEDKAAREELIAKIKAKKEELRLKEQYLYFYDNLKRSRVTRIEYN